MDRSSLLYRFLRLLLVTAGVYLSFRYLLPIVYPFLLAYILIRLLYPLMSFLHRNWHLPRFLSYYGTLLLFFFSVFGIVTLTVWKLCAQLRLFFQNFPIYRQLLGDTLNRQAQKLCHCMDYYLNLEHGTVFHFCEQQLSHFEESGARLLTTQAGKTMMNCLTGSFHLLVMLVILIISMLLLTREIDTLHENYRKSAFFEPIHFILVRIKEGGLSYLRTEGIILIVNWSICSAGLFLIHNPYFFLFGMAIAIFDAFPVLGSGMIFIPWSLYAFFSQNYYQAAVLITVYLITVFVRELLEAKLLGKGLGLSPFLTITSIFIGIELFGVMGILLGPLAVVLIQAILALENKNGFIP